MLVICQKWCCLVGQNPGVITKSRSQLRGGPSLFSQNSHLVQAATWKRPDILQEHVQGFYCYATGVDTFWQKQWVDWSSPCICCVFMTTNVFHIKFCISDCNFIGTFCHSLVMFSNQSSAKKECLLSSLVLYTVIHAKQGFCYPKKMNQLARIGGDGD